VPLWHPIYRESYSLDSLRASAEQPGPAPGLWDGLRAISRLAHAGCRAGDLRVTPFNGRLFSPSRTPLAERHDLDDAAGRRALLALATRPTVDHEGRERTRPRSGSGAARSRLRRSWTTTRVAGTTDSATVARAGPRGGVGHQDRSQNRPAPSTRRSQSRSS
jgi:hypothetical protein